MKEKILTEICSGLQYDEDRGELEHIRRVETRVRYTAVEVSEFVVVGTDGHRYCVTATKLPGPPLPDEDDE